MQYSKLFLYTHIPYCLSRCSYCDFVTFEKDKILPSSSYIELVSQEIKSQSQFFKNSEVQTCYFGGGTPSLLPASEIAQLLCVFKKHFRFREQPEITLEINPGTLDEQKLTEYQHMGINRFSLGVQTFNEWFLKVSRRFHTAEDSLKTLRLFQKEKLNFSLDLMFGLPKQSLKDLQEDVNRALEFNPPHISLYNLTLASKHPLNKNRATEQEQLEMHLWLEEKLKAHGLIKYEISNFAKQGLTSQHNQAYWKGQSVLGLGLSAHSYLKPCFLEGFQNATASPYGIRFWNASQMETYIKQISLLNSKTPFDHLNSSQKEFLKDYEALTDFCYTRLRTKEGLCEKELKALYPQYLCELVLVKLKNLLKKSWLEQAASSFRLTQEGEILSNQVFLELTFSQKDFHFSKNAL